MIKPMALSVAVLMFCASFSASASAATYTFQHGAGGYLGSADTGLSASDPDFAQGSATEVSIDASDGGLPSQALLRFDGLFGAGAGQIAAGDVITNATLTLNITSAGSGIRFFDMLQTWNESTITWNNATGGIQTDGIEAAATSFLYVGANDGGTNVGAGLLVLDVTSALQRMQSGAVPGFGWALLPFVPDGTNGVDFLTRETADVLDRPLLTVQVSAVPEPSSIAMGLAGLLGLLTAARKRADT